MIPSRFHGTFTEPELERIEQWRKAGIGWAAMANRLRADGLGKHTGRSIKAKVARVDKKAAQERLRQHRLTTAPGLKGCT